MRQKWHQWQADIPSICSVLRVWLPVQGLLFAEWVLGLAAPDRYAAGMAEAQTFCSAVLRLISMDERWREPVVKAGALRYMLPLMEAKLSPARWNARQMLINLSMSAHLLPTLQLYKVPNYVHGANIPGAHYERPYAVAGDDLEKLPPHLAETRSAAQAARAAGLTATSKPSPLKPFGISGAARPSTLQVSS